LCLELDCNTIFDSARNRECRPAAAPKPILSKHGSIAIDFTL
jgi:hypothetical protein